MNTGTFCYILHFLLFLYKINCTRANKSKLSCRSFAISLYKISYGSAVSSLVKLCFPALLLHSPCILFVAAKIINLSDLADL